MLNFLLDQMLVFQYLLNQNYKILNKFFSKYATISYIINIIIRVHFLSYNIFSQLSDKKYEILQKDEFGLT